MSQSAYQPFGPHGLPLKFGSVPQPTIHSFLLKSFGASSSQMLAEFSVVAVVFAVVSSLLPILLLVSLLLILPVMTPSADATASHHDHHHDHHHDQYECSCCGM